MIFFVVVISYPTIKMPTQTEIADAETRADALFKQKQQELEAVKALYKKLLNESKKQEKICDDCPEELYWSEKRAMNLCPNCDIDESDYEEETKTCHTCKKEYEVEPGRVYSDFHDCNSCRWKKDEEGIHKTISDEEGILACKKVFEKMKGELVGKP